MPTYDYACAACGHVFEIFEKHSENESKPCPRCRKGRARRRITGGAGVLFKGSGFHVTDYKRSLPTSSAPHSKPESKKSDTQHGKTEKK